MPGYHVSQIRPDDKPANQQLNLLLIPEGTRRDASLDYTYDMFDEEMNLIAAGGYFGNTFRYLVVGRCRQGEGLVNQIMTHLMEIQVSRGNTRLFLYTECSSARFFADLGLYRTTRTGGQVAFMGNREDELSSYLQRFSNESGESGRISSQKRYAALIMNVNPFALDYLHLAERTSAGNDTAHLFMISRGASLIPLKMRKRLVTEGTSHLDNIIHHDSGPYIISNATLPSCSQKDMGSIIEGHAKPDLVIFTGIAHVLSIGRRYIGEESRNRIAGTYNQIMEKGLPRAGIQCNVIPRKQQGGAAVGASTVHGTIEENHMEFLPSLAPPSTLRYLSSKKAAPALYKIHEVGDIIHYRFFF